MREQHRGARLEVGRHLFVPDALLDVVGHEQRHDLRAPHRLRDRAYVEARLFRGRARAAAVAQADDDVDARVAQVQGMCVALAAVADDGDLAVEEMEITVAMNRCHGAPFDCRPVRLIQGLFASGNVRARRG